MAPHDDIIQTTWFKRRTIYKIQGMDKKYEDQNLAGELDHVSFNAVGLGLAYETYIQLGRTYDVEYQGETEGGGLMS